MTFVPTIINLNSYVTIKLTAEGVRVAVENFNRYAPTLMGTVHPDTERTGVIRLLLWEMARVFGPFMYIGGPIIFESMNIDVEPL